MRIFHYICLAASLLVASCTSVRTYGTIDANEKTAYVNIDSTNEAVKEVLTSEGWWIADPHLLRAELHPIAAEGLRNPDIYVPRRYRHREYFYNPDYDRARYVFDVQRSRDSSNSSLLIALSNALDGTTITVSDKQAKKKIIEIRGLFFTDSKLKNTLRQTLKENTK